MNSLIRPAEDADRASLITQWQARWGSTRMVTRGVVHDLTLLPCLLALADDGAILGAAAYHCDGAACELVSLDAFVEGQGVGGALIAALADRARAESCARLWLITTNDNTHALRFYQRRGFRLAALYPDAITEARRIKPEIPLIGNDGIPIRDEIELDMTL